MWEQLLTKKQLGLSAVEVIMGVAILAAIIVAVGSAIISNSTFSPSIAAQRKAISLANEAMTAVEAIRDASFAGLITGVHGLDTSGTTWGFTGTSDTVDGFTRSISISNLTTYSKQIEVTINWNPIVGNPKTITTTKLISDWQRTVPIGPTVSWAAAIVSGSINLDRNWDAYDVDISGNYAYAVRAGGRQGRNNYDPTLVVINISDPTNPTEVAAIPIPDTSIFIEISGNYAYVSSTEDNSELSIINITNPTTPILLGTYNASGNADANDIFVSGNYVFLTRQSSNQDEFIVVNTTVKALPTTAGSVNVGADALDVKVVGNYAYVATTSNNSEIQIYDVSNPNNISSAGQVNLPGNTDPYTLATDGSILAVSLLNDEIVFLDLSNPTSPSTISTFDSGGTNYELEIFGTLMFGATNIGQRDLTVWDISNLSSVVEFGTVNSQPLNGLAYDDALDVVVGVGSNNATEILVYQPS